MERAVRITRGDDPVITTVDGVPEDAPPAWRVSDAAREVLAECDNASGTSRPLLSKDQVAVSYASHRGRISSTELASIMGASHTNVGSVLKRLASAGVLRPSSPAGRGKGFHYLYDGDGAC